MLQISPRVDIAFSKIFGVEENKDLLISLINAIVSKEDQVQDVTLLNPYNTQSLSADAMSILSIKAICQDGTMLNIGIEISDAANYEKRALYYWGKIYTDQRKESQGYAAFRKTIGIHILNCVLIPKAKKYHNVFHITEKAEGFQYFRDLELHTIELKKFCSDGNEELSEIIGKVKGALDMWTAFLTSHDLLRADDLPWELNKVELKKAISVLEVMRFTNEEREIYEGQLKWLRMEASAIKKYQQDAMKEGRAEGKAQGRAESKAEVAKKLLVQNIDIGTISAATGLSVAQIRKL